MRRILIPLIIAAAVIGAIAVTTRGGHLGALMSPHFYYRGMSVPRFYYRG